MRPLYEAPERRLRALVGFEAKSDPLTPGQRAVADAAATMVKAAGIELGDVVKGWRD